MDTDFQKAYYDCLSSFNNVASKLVEEIEADTEAYKSEKIARRRGELLSDRTIKIGKLMMLDQVMCFMFHEIGMEVEKIDFNKRFNKT